MRKIFTLLFVGLAAFSASAQQVVKTFPSAKQSKSGAPLLAAPRCAPRFCSSPPWFRGTYSRPAADGWYYRVYPPSAARSAPPAASL